MKLVWCRNTRSKSFLRSKNTSQINVAMCIFPKMFSSMHSPLAMHSRSNDAIHELLCSHNTQNYVSEEYVMCIMKTINRYGHAKYILVNEHLHFILRIWFFGCVYLKGIIWELANILHIKNVLLVIIKLYLINMNFFKKK